MSIEELLRAMEWLKVETGSLACLGCEYESNCGMHGCRILREAIAYISILEQKKQRWIPVTERLPKLIPSCSGTEYSETVNVLTTGRKVLTAIYDGNDFIADAEFWDADGEAITHWTPVLLPLPQPLKEE